MEYSSSEDDELVEDDLDNGMVQSDTNLHVEVPNSLHFLEHSGNSLLPVDNSMANELLASDANVKNEDPYLGMEFESETAARNFYNAYALRLGFGIRVARSRTERRKGVEVLVMKRFVCLKEGHHKKKVTEYGGPKKKRKRLSIRDGCPAMMEVVRRGPEKWVVTKLVLEHTHVVVSPDKVREIQLSRLSGKDLEHQNYLKEMRLKVFGEGDAQSLLEYFKRIQAMNSGFFYAMQVDNRNCMTNVFWADTRARMAYKYFGDAVTFDTTYKKNKHMMPFALFTGVNHHGQPIVFGSALVIDNTESSYTWLFETWIAAMFGRHPISLTTDHDKAVMAAVGKIFPNTCHRLCRWRILARCKRKLLDVYSRYPSFHHELKKCVNESDTVEALEISWKLLIDKYDLRENAWLQALYNARFKWIPAYLKGSFFAEMSGCQRPESINKFFKKRFNTRVSLEAFLAKFDEDLDERYEKELQEDFATLHCQQMLETESPLEKQAADIYTRMVFRRFQAELLEAYNNLYVVKILDGALRSYSVERGGEGHIVVVNDSEKKALCTCYKFEYAGILCRHVLRIFLLTRVTYLPEQCILERWTRKAKSGLILDEHGAEMRNYFPSSSVLRYNDLFRDAIKCAEKGATSAETYKAAKDMLHKAFAEIVGLQENMAKTKQHRA